MGNEYIAHKLDSVARERGQVGGARVRSSSVQAATDLMTHLWLRVTLGSGPPFFDPHVMCHSFSGGDRNHPMGFFFPR